MTVKAPLEEEYAEILEVLCRVASVKEIWASEACDGGEILYKS